ncbi:uncharacterized protein PAC_18316 [Phialocephala subalpina]|uniref:Heterokaryon incompatibility domain-containing protein n=1 Tax=Phialocephala subalpina TaxID=576137 RepID=A0A1L7XTX4_9HELO|nr:uncharacterized protein PAC_18316 [Phialocephala subalpina]
MRRWVHDEKSPKPEPSPRTSLATQRALFRYECLNTEKAQIRFVYIDPAKRASDPLRCQLKTVDMSSNPQYIAISYTWGGTNRSRPLILNGKLMHITVSLEQALYHFRSLFLSDTPFWIDALCINQEDNMEKSTEIRRMLSIYKAATKVVVWLGLSNEGAVAALDKMNEFIGFYINSNKPLDESAKEFVTDMDNARRTIYQIQDLMRRPWFSRVWIVQEVAAAKEILYLCGSQSAPGQLLPSIVDAIDNTTLKDLRKSVDEGIDWESDQGTFIMLQHDVNWIAIRFFKLLESVTRQVDPPPLWDLILTLKDYEAQATDPRDYIFALLGIANDSAALGIAADYSLSTSACYTHVAKAFLKKGYMRILWLCTQPKSQANLPSWVPDWSTTWSFRSVRRAFTNPMYTPALDVNRILPNTFSASRTSKPSITFRGGNYEILRMDGILIDTVAETGPGYTPMVAENIIVTDEGDHITTVHNDVPRGAFTEVQRRFTDIQNLAATAGPGASEPSMILRTLLRDMEVDVSETADYSSRAHYFAQDSTTWRRLNPQKLHIVLEQVTSRVSMDKAQVANSWVNLLQQSDGRRGFVSTQGYLGLGPLTMQQNDTIMIPFGSEVPFLTGYKSLTYISQKLLNLVTAGKLAVGSKDFEMFAKLNFMGRINNFLEIKLKWEDDHNLRPREVLNLSRSCDSTDPRDRVYAMLGLVDPSYNIIPSYHRSNTVTDVFTAAARAAIMHDNRLDILLDANEVGRNKNLLLPTWVPDFTTHLGRFPLCNSQYGHESSEYDADWQKGLENAPYRRLPPPKFLQDCHGASYKILECIGADVGPISQEDYLSTITEYTRNVATGESITVQWKSCLEANRMKLTDPHGEDGTPSQTVEAAFYDTLSTRLALF